jgi:hypothetical protein
MVGMREAWVWSGVGAGGGLLVAAVISVSLGGPGWPYYLILGALLLALAIAVGLRRPSGLKSTGAEAE